MGAPNATLVGAIRGCRQHLVSSAVFSALINFLYLTPTIYMLQVYDRVIPTGGMTTLLVVSAVAAIGLLTMSGLDLIRSRLLVRCAARLDRHLAEPVMSTILRRADLSRLQRLQLMREYDSFRSAIAGAAALAAFDAPWTPIYIAAAFLLNPGIGLLCAGSSALLLCLAWANEQGTHAPLSKANEAASIAYAHQDEASSFAAEVRALGMCDGIIAKQLWQRRAATDLQAKASFRAGGYGACIKALRLILQSAALGYGAYLAIDHRISPGAVMAASLLLARALAPIEQIVAVWRSIVSARDVYAKLSMLLSSPGKTEYMALPPPRGEISLEGVSVLAPQKPVPLLSEVTLSIAPGEMVGVVGHSGAGKSTLLKLLVGLVRPSVGNIRIDGAVMTSWSPDALADHLGYLPQNFLLFAGTVRENISRFKSYLPEKSQDLLDQQVVMAAQAAGAHQMILRLPKGYDTPVGLGGMGLSAGQTQRVALARAFFGSPRVLVLDEPNANLDVEGENYLIRTLAQLRQRGVTIIVSGHRGAVLSSADKLIMLGGGRLDRFCAVSDLINERRKAAMAEAGAQGMRA